MSHIREDAEVQVVLALCDMVGSAKALAVKLCLEAGDFSSYLGLVADPLHYLDHKAYARDYGLLSFLRKWERPMGTDTRGVALSSWKLAEARCRTRNDMGSILDQTALHPVIYRARQLVADVLGPIAIGQCMSRCDWSNGATLDKRRGSTHTTKMSFPISVTPSALRYLDAYLRVDTGWRCAGGVLTYQLAEGNRFDTVPKNARTDRVISIEPTGNIFLQKGVGSFLKERLRRVGLSTKDQTRNQSMAARAHKELLATIDLEAASDTISWRVVFDLLPIDWFIFLDDLRSHSTLVDGEWVPLEKFSGMGNGFTFELETLIFWALSRASVEFSSNGKSTTVGTYGDDIIVPQASAPLVVEVLEHCGFVINRQKSFLTGRFFESCGKHFFDGFDVTPIFQKKTCMSKEREVVPHEHIRLYNRVMRWCSRVGVCIEQSKLWKLLESQKWEVWGDKWPRIPLGAGDDRGYLTDWDDFYVDRNHGFYCRVYVQRTKRLEQNGSLSVALHLRRKHTHGFAMGSDTVTVPSAFWRSKYSFVSYEYIAEGLDAEYAAQAAV